MTNTTAEDIGRRIARHRQRLDLTQNELAESSQVTRGYVAMLETGRAFPSVRVLQRIASALQVTPNDLLDGGDG